MSCTTVIFIVKASMFAVRFLKRGHCTKALLLHCFQSYPILPVLSNLVKVTYLFRLYIPLTLINPTTDFLSLAGVSKVSQSKGYHTDNIYRIVNGATTGQQSPQ